MNSTKKMMFQIILASLLRLWLMNSERLTDLAIKRIEISTPTNSWKRVTEGVYQLNHDINPYVGDQFHEPPHNLYIYQQMMNNTNNTGLICIFIICDILTAILLFKTARKYLTISLREQQQVFKGNNKRLDQDKLAGGDNAESKEVKKPIPSLIFLREENVKQFPVYCALVYLFNPFSIINCVGRTTTVFSNTIYAGILYCISHDIYILSALLTAFGACQTMYPLIFLSPIVLKFSRRDSLFHTVFSGIAIIFQVFLLIFGLLYLSHNLSGSWNFIEHVYGFVINIGNLRPNIGLFWYFFTEMFEHFHDLFIAAFQINAFLLYIIPLSIRFRKDPLFLSLSLIVVTTIFKSYPCLGDIGFYVGVLPIWFNLLCYLQQSFLVTVVFLITIILGPVVWYLWVITGTANANFFFGVTLCFAAAQIFLVTDILFAYAKREFWIKNNCKGMREETTVRLVLE